MVFDQQFWEENGYVVISDAVPSANLQAVVDAIWEFTGKRPDKPDTWYQSPCDNSGMVNMTQHQSLWDNRQHPRVHAAFTQLWETSDLWVTINRANMNPPVTADWDRKELLHWDYEVGRRGLRPAVQGIFCLTDTTPDMGGFHCVPGSHRRLEEWQARHPEGKAPKVEDVADKAEVVAIAGKAGDLLIWHQGLIHGNGRNLSDRPRLAQYICMTPAGYIRTVSGLTAAAPEVCAARVETWELGAYPGALAKSLGVAEGRIERWLGHLGKEGEAVEALANIPTDPDRALLTADQLAALPGLLERHRIPAVVLERPLPEGGVSLGWLRMERLSQRIVEAIQAEWGLSFDLKPAHLTELGQTLLGSSKAKAAPAAIA